MRRAALLLALLAAPAAAQQQLEVRRGDLQVLIGVKGTVVIADSIRLKAAIDGRVEDLDPSTYTWAVDGRPLGFLANREMAAILDSHTTTIKGVVEDRWRKVYRPTPIRCPADCFVLRVFVKNKEWLKPKSLMFEAAQKVQLIARVRPEEAHLVRDGQPLEFWAADNPQRKLRASVSRYVLDIQGHRVNPGGTFTVDLTPKRYLDPGTKWEGFVNPVTKKNVLIAPTAALIEHNGVVYLPIKVSTGITTETLTEITSGTDDKRPVLVLDEARLRGALRYHGEPDVDALQRRVEEEYLRAKDKDGKQVFGRPDAIEPRERRERGSGVMPDPDATYSESPFNE